MVDTQINGKVNIGLVMQKRTGNNLITGQEFCEMFNSEFQRTAFNFKVGWNTVDDLIKYLKQEGVSTVNELNQIVVFDDGFINNIEAVPMINLFISLEEVMEMRGVRAPKLILATGHQGLFDLFKKELSPEGHELFSYAKTQVLKLRTDNNGNFTISDLNHILTGRYKNVLSIENQYHGREDVARQEVQKMKASKMNQTADVANQIKAKIKASDEEKRRQEELKKAKDPVELARERQAKTRRMMKNTFKNEHTKVENANKQVKGNFTFDGSQQFGQNNQKQDNQYDPNSITNETGVSVDRETQHGKQTYHKEIEGDEFYRLRHEFHDIAKEVKQRSDLNFDEKIYNDNGRLLIGGLSQSGTSSVIANLAQYYALMKKRTLIINISDNDHITRYFNTFIPKYKKLGRKNSLSTKFSKSLTEISVPVKPNLELISDYGLTQKNLTLEKKLENYSRIIRFSSEYDVVLIDAGTNFEQVLLNTSINFLDDTLIITTQDDLAEVPLDLIHHPYQFSLKLQHLKHPIGLLINKIQYDVSNENLARAILQLPIPLDQSRLIGAISYQNDWFQQRLSGILGVSYNTTQRFIFHEFAKKIILRDVI